MTVAAAQTSGDRASAATEPVLPLGTAHTAETIEMRPVP